MKNRQKLRNAVFAFLATLLACAGLVATSPPAQAGAIGSSGWEWPLGSSPTVVSGGEFLGNGCGPGGNSALGGYGFYDNGIFHLGVDMSAAANAGVRAIGPGTVKDTWGNFGGDGGAVFIEHTAADGSTFVALYGHVKNYITSGTVQAGSFVGDVNSDHTHFGIHPGGYGSFPNGSWGTLSCSTYWTSGSAPTSTNGFVDPVPYLTAHPLTATPPAWGGVGSATYRGEGLASGDTLYPNQYLSSANVQFALVFQADSNLVLYHNGQAIWQAPGALGQNGTRLVMQGDGNLVMYRADNSVVWHSSTNGSSGAYADLQSDGNFVIRNTTTVFWNSQTGGHPGYTHFGSDKLNTGQQLVQGQYLRSFGGRYALLLQMDGNAVLYGPGYHVLWTTGTAGSGDRLLMQSDGNLVLYAISNPRWWSGTAGANVYAILQGDGNFVVYNSSNFPLWFSGTGGQI